MQRLARFARFARFQVSTFPTNLSPDAPDNLAQLESDCDDLFSVNLAAAIAASPLMAETMAEIEREGQMEEEVPNPFLDSATPRKKADYTKFVCSVVLNRVECQDDK